MSSFFQDVRYGFRSLAARPAFAAILITTLALGIGANTSIFSVLKAVLINPLPYDQPDRLVLIWDRIEATGFLRASVPAPDVIDFREQAPSLESVAAMNNSPSASLTGDGPPEQIVMTGVTANFFSTLGVAPALGRTFLPEDETPFPPGAFANPATVPTSHVVLSSALWKNRFASDPEVIGRTIKINGNPFEVVGVMPEGFRLLMPADAGMSTDIDAWNVMNFDFRSAPRNNAFLRVVARMKDGATLEQVRADLATIAERQRAEFSYHRDGNIFVDAYPMHEDVVAHVQPVLFALLGAVGFVLLIACANIANLLLVRASTRQREIAVRAALGGGRRRIVRQLLTESFVIAVLGGLAGLLLADWGVDVLIALQPQHLPRLSEIGIDTTALAFTAGLSAVAAVLFGLPPALQASRPDLTDALKDRQGNAASQRRRRMRDGLVVAEVALSMVLLFGAGLMLRSFALLQKSDLGFAPHDVQTFALSLPFVQYSQPDERTNFYRSLDNELTALPGVEAAGAVFPLPLGGRFWTGPYTTVGADPGAATVEANYRLITPGYFDAMGINVRSGRTFSDTDNANNLPVAIVDRTFAEKVWPGESAIGKSVEVQILFTGQNQWVEVVGVVDNVKHDNVQDVTRETIYFPYRLQLGFPAMSVVVRHSGNDEGLMNLVRGRVATLDSELPVAAVRTMDDYVDQALAPTRFTLIIAAVFAALALTMASIGLYGVMSSSVKQRTGELGIRIAFGASRGTILRSVVGQGLLLSVTGVILGVVVSLGLGKVFANLVVGVSPTDPLALVGVGGVLIVTSWLASYFPARRAVSVDPIIALRNE